jgi:hypothetical protein
MLDLTQAPSTWGSITQSCLERMVAIMESAARPLAVLCEDEMQVQQMTRILKMHAPTQGMLFTMPYDAIAWVFAPRSVRSGSGADLSKTRR